MVNQQEGAPHMRARLPFATPRFGSSGWTAPGVFMKAVAGVCNS
jgi:hypothetical protein